MLSRVIDWPLLYCMGSNSWLINSLILQDVLKRISCLENKFDGMWQDVRRLFRHFEDDRRNEAEVALARDESILQNIKKRALADVTNQSRCKSQKISATTHEVKRTCCLVVAQFRLSSKFFLTFSVCNDKVSVVSS